MRAKAPALLSLLQGENLDLVVLVEIQTATAPLRYALDPHPRTWNGLAFEPTSGALSEIEENAERGIPSLRLSLQNVDGVLGARAWPQAENGEDLTGRRVVLRQADRSVLTGADPECLVIEWTFFIDGYSFVGREAVVFDLGVFPAEMKVPTRAMQGLRCWWEYRGAHCGYVGDLPTCDLTPEDCGRHFPDEPRRFGGFPVQADFRAARV